MTRQDVPTHAHAELEALFAGLRQAHADRDAAAIADAYAPDAVIYDLAPPLGRRGARREQIAAWLATWDGPVLIDTRDDTLAVDGDLAFTSSYVRMRGRQRGREQDLWFRSTLCLRRTGGRWRIVHDHTSVPFYMDGSYRAAIDLEPSD